jgi:hypothetical protein
MLVHAWRAAVCGPTPFVILLENINPILPKIAVKAQGKGNMKNTLLRYGQENRGMV